MDHVLETLTRAPSQVLTKSASSFGEEAAKVLGVFIEESLKNVTDDACKVISDGAQEFSKSFKHSMSDLGVTMKEALLDSFVEWGYSLERAFTSVGNRLENGLTNSGQSISSVFDQTLNKRLIDFNETTKMSLEKLNDNISQLGLQHIKEIKVTFKDEIRWICYGWLLISFSLFLIALTVATNFQLMSLVRYFIEEFKLVIALAFIGLSGFYLRSLSMLIPEEDKDQQPQKVEHHRNRRHHHNHETSSHNPITKPSTTLENENHQDQKFPDVISKEEESTLNNGGGESDKKSALSSSLKIVFFIVAGLGFFIGNLSRDLTSSYSNLLNNFVVMGVFFY